jgi:alpha/beta superfamily hydrolase
MILKKIEETFGEHIGVFAQTTASFCKKLIITSVFKKKRHFFHQKLSKLAENCDHNIDTIRDRIHER